MTLEYAVMIDSKIPLKITDEGKKICSEDYYKSWMESGH